MEKPDSAMVSPPSSPPLESSPQALKASTPAATSATAALKFVFIVDSFPFSVAPEYAALLNVTRADYST